MLKCWKRWSLAAVLCVAGAAAATECELVEHLPANATAVYYLNTRSIMNTPWAERLKTWPEIAQAYSDYLSINPDAPKPEDVFEEVVIGFNTGFSGAQPAMAVLFAASDPVKLEKLILGASNLKAVPDTVPPTWRDDDLGMQKLNDRTLLLTINDADGVLTATPGKGVASGEVRRMMAEQRDNLAWLVMQTPGDLAPNGEKGIDPLQNVMSNLRSVTANLASPAGDPAGIELSAFINCSDANVAQMVAMQAQLLITSGLGLFFNEDRQLGRELVGALKVQPQADRVSVRLLLNGSQVDRLLDFAEKQLDKERLRSETRAKEREQRLNAAGAQ